ncbi:phosphatidylserine lipase ABHD16A-like [Symsagittifera roscoffensis]|uniref:phosphatidylserine lipase ABHD16A-like n=1 Tax=Symsagittifera roscoffensis TaxID=84072 RepID=UPI00307C6719
MAMSKIVGCLIGPKVYRYMITTPEKRFLPYEPTLLETMPETAIGVIKTLFSFTRNAWFLIIPYMYMRDYFTRQGCLYLLNWTGVVTLLFCFSFAVRATGRFLNPVYSKFVDVRYDTSLSPEQKKEALAKFSYEFSHCDPDFDLSSSSDNRLRDFKPTFRLPPHFTIAQSSFLGRIFKMPYDLLCNVAMNVVGRRMIYPGSLQILNSLLSEPRDEARSKFLLKYEGARRVKLVSELSDEVDAFVVDRRNKDSSVGESLNGDKIVICTEGNGGFYEIGIMATPLEAGYSVLGWNHLGFGGSSGLPWPENEQAAIDTVYKYARVELGFADEDIVLFAWSIGGYATSWLAMNYPNIGAVVIDASFDDLVPLALAKMPQFASGLITRGIRLFMDLRVSEQLKGYPGPVLFYRRTRDEIITTQMHDLSSNRGNDLALDLIEHRYPHLFEESDAFMREYALDYLSEKLDASSWGGMGGGMDSNQKDPNATAVSYSTTQSHVEKFRMDELNSKGDWFPSQLGRKSSESEKKQILECLLQKYITDLADVHCTPLPVSKFRIPEPI